MAQSRKAVAKGVWAMMSMRLVIKTKCDGGLSTV